MNDNAKAWVAALRSGQYKKGTSRLHTVSPEGNHTYCCLGVACELAADAGLVERKPDMDAVHYSGYRALLPPVIVQWLGLRDDGGLLQGPPLGEHKVHTLVALNDTEQWTFASIADFIEQNQERVFK